MWSKLFDKKTVGVISVALFWLLSVTLYFKNFDQVWQITVAGCAVLLGLILVLFHPFSFFVGTIFLIPLSVEMEIGGGAQATFPSEGMLLLLLPVLWLFHSTYWKSVSKILQHPLTLFILADLFVQLITSLTSSHLDVSMKRFVIRVLFVAGFFVTITSLKSAKKILWVLLAYVIGVLPVAYLTFRNFQKYDFDFKTVFSISKPYFPDHTMFGACLAFLIPLLVLLSWGRKATGWSRSVHLLIGTVTIIVIASEFLALSRAALLSVLIAGLFGLFVHWKMRFRAVIYGLIVLLIGAFALKMPIYKYLERTEAVSNDGEIGNHLSSVTNIQTDASNLERVNRWVCAVRMFGERPLVGFGPGTYQFEYNRFQTLEYKTYISTNVGDKGNAHSEYLTFLSENGIFGALVFLCIVFGSIYFGMQNHQWAESAFLRMLNLGILLGLITYFFHGIFNAFMDQSKMGFLYFAALGTIVWINLKLKNDTKPID